MIVKTKTVLIAGVGGAIGSALAEKYKDKEWNVISISRKEGADLVTNLSDESCIDSAREFIDSRPCPDLVINCCGLLHDENNMPEKELADVSTDWLMKNVEVNLNTHINLAKAVSKCLSSERSMTWVSLSAMVGSIGDNGLGGWYSYRISKASLNMLIRNLSIEWKRKHRENRVFAIHPGTTKSDMSAPFRIREDKLYDPQLSADRIINVIETSGLEANGQFLNWNGENILW